MWFLAGSTTAKRRICRLDRGLLSGVRRRRAGRSGRLDVEIQVFEDSGSSMNETRHSRVYDSMKDMILSGSLEPGATIIENSLAGELGVSRTPVREALRALEHDDLIERTGRGLRVKERSAEELYEIYDVRIILEPEAARAAAARRTELDVVRLKGALEVSTGNEDEADPNELASRNREFHRLVWRAAHNQALYDVLERLAMYVGRYPITTYHHPERRRTSRDEHEAVVNAIVAGDGDEAARVSREHIVTARQLRLRLFEYE